MGVLAGYALTVCTKATWTRAALIGAAIGTVVMPGVGTGADAALGDKVGEKLKELFGR